MKRTAYVCVLALVLVALGAPLGASTFERMGLEKLVAESTSVVEGEVLAVESFWDAEGQVIVTEATLQVRNTVLGKASGVIRVKTFGGTVDGYRVEAHGFPTFEKNDRLFLFLTADTKSRHALRVTGYQQGQFHVVTGNDKVERAESAIDGDALLVEGRAATKQLPNALPLAELEQLVRDQAEVLRLEKARLEGDSDAE